MNSTGYIWTEPYHIVKSSIYHEQSYSSSKTCYLQGICLTKHKQPEMLPICHAGSNQFQVNLLVADLSKTHGARLAYNDGMALNIKMVTDTD